MLEAPCEDKRFVSSLAGRKAHNSWHRSIISDFYNTGMVSQKMCINLRNNKMDKKRMLI